MAERGEVNITVNVNDALTPILETIKATGIAFEALADISDVIAEVRAEMVDEIAEVLESGPEEFDFDNAREQRAECIETIQACLAAIVITDETIAKIRPNA